MSTTSSANDLATSCHYAKPVIQASSTPKDRQSKSPHIRYPKVVVDSTIRGGTSSPSYAVPAPRYMSQKVQQQQEPPHYSTTQLQFEHVKHRCKMLDDENQKLMKMQSDVVNDANRRVQMHINEIRMLKDENKKMHAANKELRDLCCFLDDDRQKTRRLAREWQKFGRYTSNLMKQEIDTYHQKLSGMEEKLSEKEREVDELRQLCMYLDEQRQYLMANAHHTDDVSEDLGCGSSEQSAGSDDKDYCYNQHKEKTLRRITEQMTASMCSEDTDEQRKEASKRERSRLLGYIQSLENRIKHLEMSHNHEGYWTSQSNVASDCDEKTVIERSWTEEEEKKDKKGMFASMTSTMSSSGCTTFASSGTDDNESVYVMGDDIDIGNLEVRPLSRIDEEKTLSIEQSTTVIEESAKMPPAIAPGACSSLLSVDKYDDLPKANDLMRSASESYRPTTILISAKGTPRCVSVEKSNPL